MCNTRQSILCDNKNCEFCSIRSIKNSCGIERYDQLIFEFDKIKNIDINGNKIDLTKLPKGSTADLLWNCLHGHSFKVPLCTRTSGHDCKECQWESMRKIPLKDTEKMLLRDDSKVISTSRIGDINEKYVYDLLKKHQKVQDIQLLGYLGGYGDIRMKLKGCNDYKLLQVKTLTKKKNNSFTIDNSKSYPEDLLFAMISSDHKYFAIEFAGNLSEQCPYFSFNNIESKYKDVMFTDKNIFIKTIIANINDSVTNVNIEDQLNTENQKKEYAMRQRIKAVCESHNITYKDNETNSDTIDCYINDKPIQLKYTGRTRKNQKVMNLNLYKNGGYVNGRCRTKPYHIKDGFEYIIVETKKFHGQFCIIPKTVLHQRGFISDDKGQKGRRMCTIAPFDYDKKHWINIYWNNWKYLL